MGLMACLMPGASDTHRRISCLADCTFGRSHRAPIALNKIKESMALTKEILKIPKDYHVAMVPASDTGAVEMMMWQLLGPRGVTVCHWESFGGGWWTDASKELKLPKLRNLQADFGILPDLKSVDFNDDVVFTWNGTTSGVKVPNGDWIPDDRAGLTICDATSAAFAMDIPWGKIDVLTYSWQKCLGGEGAHGMLIISPRTVARLESYNPTRPIPKIFRLTKKGKLDKSIFNGSVINTPSMVCFEDYLDALKWAKSVGGLEGLISRSMRNWGAIKEFVDKTPWIQFLAKDPATISNTSVRSLFSASHPRFQCPSLPRSTHINFKPRCHRGLNLLGLPSRRPLILPSSAAIAHRASSFENPTDVLLRQGVSLRCAPSITCCPAGVPRHLRPRQGPGQDVDGPPRAQRGCL